MAKQTYDYIQVQIPVKAKERIDSAYKCAEDSGQKVRKADLWSHAAQWVEDQIKNNGYAEIILNGESK